VQCGAGEHDQWPGYMTVLVIDYGIVILISRLTAVICWMIKFGVPKCQDCISQETM